MSKKIIHITIEISDVPVAFELMPLVNRIKDFCADYCIDNGADETEPCVDWEEDEMEEDEMEEDA